MAKKVEKKPQRKAPAKVPKKEEKNSKGKIIIIALLLLVIVALGVVIYLLLHKPKPERGTTAGLAVGDIDEKAANARFTTDMNMSWSFPSGSAVSSNAEIGNSASNLYDCYFEVYLDDEEQTLLYSSPVIPVGKKLDKLELNQVLPDGTYDAVCTYHLLDDEDPDRELGTVSFAVSLMFVNE
nr:hypothetical protein [uncultured Schaedlerella sp.]